MTAAFAQRTTVAMAGLILLASFTHAADNLNQLTPAEKKAGWQLLFDGKSTQGWRNYRKKSVSDGWKIVDGALTRAGKGAGDIVTKQQYGSFELSIEYRISKGGNSGIMFHVTEEYGAPWQTGPEIQIQDNKDGHDPQKSGWVYQLYDAPMDATRPAGEWNELHIRITPKGSEINMNGLRYSRFQKGSAEWNRKVAKSKFARYENFGKATKGYICLQDHGNEVAYRNIKVRVLNSAAPNPVDGDLAVKIEPAFPNVKWTGWNPVDSRGRPKPLRPIVITNAGDGSNRIFVATQRGLIHSLSSPAAKQSKVFMDIQSKVTYNDSQNEEGLLGMAFHPDYKKNGEIYVYYSTREAPQTSVISRFRVSKSDPGKADPTSEEEIMRIKQPFWNHNGGTICFGPDGYLYVGLGDGGNANDPYKNAQNLSTLLGSILRIDVNKKSAGKAYSVPGDNPFINNRKARAEIWAYGLRNVWRMSFDRQTGDLWAADVGQNLWEEINLVTRGGNYGWNLREAAHPFGKSRAGNAKLIDPVWEYDHEVGKSITGGVVYRGKKVPELVGAYLYADYVSGKLWALKYDASSKKVLGNYAIPAKSGLTVITYGEDEQGEVYFATVTGTGKGIYRFVSKN